MTKASDKKSIPRPVPSPSSPLPPFPIIFHFLTANPGGDTGRYKERVLPVERLLPPVRHDLPLRVGDREASEVLHPLVCPDVRPFHHLCQKPWGTLSFVLVRCRYNQLFINLLGTPLTSNRKIDEKNVGDHSNKNNNGHCSSGEMTTKKKSTLPEPREAKEEAKHEAGAEGGGREGQAEEGSSPAAP